MAQPKELSTLLSIMGDLENMRPKLILQEGDHLVSILYLMNRARADIRRAVKWSIDAITAPVYWLENDAEGKAVIWMSTRKGPRVWMAEYGSKLVPP